MAWLKRCVYKLLGIYTQIHIMDERYDRLKNDVKIKHVPNVGDLIYFEEGGAYFMVVKVLHLINDRQQIWVVVQQFTEKV